MLMRKQISAANWKMNGTAQQAETLLKEVMDADIRLKEHQLAVFAVPFPFLQQANKQLGNQPNYYIAAQNCSHHASGAYTVEVSADMLKSIGIQYCIVGHSERREYFAESIAQLAQKIDLLLKNEMFPIFCCGTLLQLHDIGVQEKYVEELLIY